MNPVPPTINSKQMHHIPASVTVDSVGSLCPEVPPCSNCFSKLFQDFDGRFPVDASIGNTNTLLQPGWAFGRYFLIALVDVRFDHDANDTRLTLPELVAYNLRNFGLIPMIFVRIACAAVSAYWRRLVLSVVSEAYHVSNQSS